MIIGGGAAFGVWVSVERSRARAEHELMLSRLNDDVAMAATELVTCVLGDDPTVAFERVRLAEELSPTPGGQWPTRCAPYAANLIALGAKSADAGIPRTLGPMKDVDVELRNASTEHLMEAVNAVAPLATKKADTRVPRPATPLVGSNTPTTALYPRDLKADVQVIDQLDGELHVSLTRLDTHTACTIDETSFAIHCTKPVSGVNVDLAYAKGAKPAFGRFASDGVEAGVVDVDGKTLIPGLGVVHGYAWPDGKLAVLSTGTTGATVLTTRAADGAISKRPSDVGSNNPRLAADHVVWKAVERLGPEAPANVRAVGLVDGTGGVIGQVGRRDGDSASSNGHCASATHLFVDMSPAFAVLDPKGHWSLVKGLPQPNDAERTLSCDGGSLRVVDVSTSTLRVQDCDASACTTKTAEIDVGDGVRAVSLGADDFLLVWRKRWGLIAARAPQQGFSSATPFSIATLEPRENPLDQTSVLPFDRDYSTKVVAVAGGAIVFFHVMGTVHALGIKRDGTAVAIADPEK